MDGSNTNNNRGEGGNDANTASGKRTKQTSLVASLPKKLRTDEKKNYKSLLQLITQDFQPFSIVEDTGFRNFVNALNPTYDLPSRKTVASTLLEAEYVERLSQVQAMH